MNQHPAQVLPQPKTKWKPYPAYKNSGIEWLGKIPTHWTMKPLKYATVLNPEVLTEDTSPNYFMHYVDIGNVDSNGRIQAMQGMHYENAPSRARRIVRDGDTIISTVRTYLRAIAFIEKASVNLIVSTGFSVLRPPANVEPQFLWRLVQSQQFIETVVAHSEGVGYPAINPTCLGSLPVWLPSKPEQETIVNFLDRETAKIDGLVAKKVRLIELLEEERTALISHAVTKGLSSLRDSVGPRPPGWGLDPNAPMKDSGIEWLGQIPKHWESAPLKHRFDVKLGKMLQPAPSTPADTLEPYLRAANILWGGVDLSDISEMWLSPAEKKKFSIEQDDLLISEGGDVGRSAIWRGERSNIYFQNAINRVRSKSDDSTHFLYYWIYTLKHGGYIDILCNKATIAHFTAEKVQAISVFLPPAEEQRLIVDFIDRETVKIDALIGKIHQHIEKLREYRTAMISAAVTGKIDVRGVAA